MKRWSLAIVRIPIKCAYLFLGHKRATTRGQGVGTELVELRLVWAYEHRYNACVADWFTANPLASQVWPRRSIVLFSGRLERRIDPRIAWASKSG